MILLSALVASSDRGMAAIHVATPSVVASGVAMTAVTFLSARIFVYLRMFVVGYAVAFAAFAAGFIVFDHRPARLGPRLGADHAAQAVPRAGLRHPSGGGRADLARLPLIAETVGLSEPLPSRSRDPSRIRYLGFLPLSEGSIGRGFLICIILINFVQTYLLILFNTWQGALFDSFQNMDAAAFWVLITSRFLAGNWVLFAITEYLFGHTC